MKVLIVEDEKNPREVLERFLSTYECVTLISFADSVERFYEEVKTKKHDLVLLDIQLYGQNSLNILEKLENEKITLPLVIITTSYDNSEYQIKAQNYYSINYLLKPIQDETLKRAICRANEVLNKSSEKEKENQNLIDYLKNYKRLPLITISDEHVFLKHENIAYIASNGNYAELFMEDGNKILAKISLTKLDNILPKKIFHKPSRSIIVNLYKIRSVHKKRKYIDFNSPHVDKVSITEASTKIIIDLLNDIS